MVSAGYNSDIKRRPDEWRGNVNARDMTLTNLLEKNIYCVRDY